MKKRNHCQGFADPKVGLQTGDNYRFMRQWFEPSITKIGFGSTSSLAALETGKKWFPYNKGGDFRNVMVILEYVVIWRITVQEIKKF